MKHIVKITVALACLATVFSCNKLMDSKDIIDAKYAKDIPERIEREGINITGVTIEDYTTIVVNLSIPDTTGVVEYGAILLNSWAKDDIVSAKPVTYVVDGKKQLTGTVKFTGLKEETSYFLQSYVYTEGGFVVYDWSPEGIKTEKEPVFEDTYIFGTYVASDIDLSTGAQAGDNYGVVIAPAEGGWNRISFYNIYDCESTILATVDPETKTIVTDAMPYLYTNSTYGDVICRGFDLVEGNIVWWDGGDRSKACVILEYDDSGTIYFGYYAANVEAGSFGYYVTVLEKTE